MSARRLFRGRAAQLQRRVFLATACSERHDGAQERNDSDFLTMHGTTSA